jgi:hypothetical protein
MTQDDIGVFRIILATRIHEARELVRTWEERSERILRNLKQEDNIAVIMFMQAQWSSYAICADELEKKLSELDNRPLE